MRFFQILATGLALSLAMLPSLSADAPSGLKSGPAVGDVGVSGEDWPAFLGRLGTGVTVDRGLSDQWPEGGPPVLWKKRIGTGYSAPSVLGGKLIVHHRKTDEMVECLRAATGEPIWSYAYQGFYTGSLNANDGPRSTPLVTEDRCYTLGADGKLLCLDFKTGKSIWTRNLSQDFTIGSMPFGIGASPILEGDLLIVLVGGQPNSGVVAFRAKTGETAWQSVGKETWDGAQTSWSTTYHWKGDEGVASYSSPIAVTIDGKRHVLCLMYQGLVSVDPHDGRVNFKHWFSSRRRESISAARPVVIGDKIFLTATYGIGSVLLEVEPAGRAVKELWRNRRMDAHWSTPIHVDGYLYGFRGEYEPNATLDCLDMKSGKIAWWTTGYNRNIDSIGRDPQTGEFKVRATGKVIPFPFFGRGSLTRVGKRFIVLGERGTLALAEMSPKGYHELARASFKHLGVHSWTNPVVAGTKVYLRDENSLLCVELGRKP
jgi:outer membrane protein assembly factor BamB